ncbi:hypothetical protein LEP1GSC171_0722 [Leptospira santarosai str. HAI1380]|uniref:Uncharacterized protein n=1 Tax=Leptospira santarosai str. ZUN179 TaxID=1049985 RepID=M6V368_9LEPT|nr:hypothetical protein LEP1GSC039_2753 [Leptospira santarosai str. 2000027870]EMO43953.1 hypothetical protein LEP1GSC187_2712 [Leptospira santarosai str. ZUN179]EMP02788.1 hypothetical protein LEP1GSC171_0722 [Leptospira santarosai str. HAI1380]
MKENKKSNAEKKSQTENLSVKTGSVPFWKRFLFLELFKTEMPKGFVLICKTD